MSRTIPFFLLTYTFISVCQSQTVNYTDTCGYVFSNGGSEKCGDMCIYYWQYCSCGGEVINLRDFGEGVRSGVQQYCCVEPQGEQCVKGKNPVGAECAQGEVIPIDNMCGDKCYNTYQDSKNLGDTAHYQCPDKCVSIFDMCRGINWCDTDVDQCNENLRCTTSYTSGAVFNSKRLGNLSHFYCIEKYTEKYETNNDEYNLIDRTDEAIRSRDKTRINWDDIVSCKTEGSLDLDGYTCGSSCKRTNGWCLEERLNTDECTNENNTTRIQVRFSSSDQKLCSNFTFWQLKPCIDGQNLGLRCTGRLQHCYFPWYLTKVTWGSGYDQPGMKTTCKDKSDQVFALNNSCPNVFDYMKDYTSIYGDNICKSDYDSNGDFGWICLTSREWIENQRDPANRPDPYDPYDPRPLEDPHNCWSSCSEPGEGCQACTNPDYFICPTSGVCIHPELLCDGHPQCQHAEDEDLDRCREKYVYNKIIEEFATVRCKSLMYTQMTTLATACNGVKECFGNEDEESCDNDTFSLAWLLIASAGFIVFYLIVKGTRYIFIRLENWFN